MGVNRNGGSESGWESGVKFRKKIKKKERKKEKKGGKNHEETMKRRGRGVSEGPQFPFITEQHYRSGAVIKAGVTVPLRALYRYSNTARQNSRISEDTLKDNKGY